MYDANKNELEILEFWQKNKIFEKSVNERPENKPYVFYDGPPFATGLPHYGHILSSVIKDVVPRYWTMKGYSVRRRWGWDCHGLPIEQLIEKELKLSGKKKIETEFGVDKFNAACRDKVLTYAREWKKMVERIGRWVEFDTAYKTMDPTYMESVWWALKNLWDRDFIYEGRKVLLYCPRCETPVSKAEVAMDNSYKDITEEAVTVKFKIKRLKDYKIELPDDTYLLAWTTTPWTLPGNVALAVGGDIDYILVKFFTGRNKKSDKPQYEHCILAKTIFEKLKLQKQEVSMMKYFAPFNLEGLSNDEEDELVLTPEIIREFKGVDLVGLEYEPLFDLPAVRNPSTSSGQAQKKAWYVAPADFVTTTEGTGIVHTAVIYGEDDYALGVQIDLPMVPLVDERGHFNDKAPSFIQGEYFKKAEKQIKEDLESRGLIFSREQNTHSYPHCWRCDTALMYNAISAWFIDVQRVKKRIIELNEKINWYPEHLKHGRFLNIIETAPDWNISRNRYWATPLPFWRCQNGKRQDTNSKKQTGCGSIVCVGSVAELKKKAVNFDKVYTTDKVEEIDLHKHLVDIIKLKCEKCGGEMGRIPEVIDCWVESASMPFAEFHYPFENKKVFENRFPGDYIAEYIAQTRAWFYYMHVLATLLFDNVSFENCVTTGTILNEKGEKLSKSKMNYTDPWKIISEYGVDALRYYLMTSVVMQADDLFFSDREVRDVYNKVVNILWNVVTFYNMYAEKDTSYKLQDTNNLHILDKWILAKLQLLVKEVTENMDNYDTVKAGRPIKDFIDELSTWYLRRSRDRFKKHVSHTTYHISEEELEQDFQNALGTLREVLLTLAKVMAPFTPFLAETMFQQIRNPKSEIRNQESVHLEEWPEVDKKMIDDKVMSDMETARKVVEMGLSLRKEAGVRVRQPLSALQVSGFTLQDDLGQIVADELNVKEVKDIGDSKDIRKKWVVKEEGELKVALNIEITEDLKKEGLAREIIRAVNDMRKEQKLTIEDRIVVEYATDDALLKSVFEKFGPEIKKSVLADELKEGSGGITVSIDTIDLNIAIKVVHGT